MVEKKSLFVEPEENSDLKIYDSQEGTDFPVDFIKSLPIFSGLSLRDLQSATEVVQRRDLEVGEYLVSESQSADNIFIIIEGSVKISVTRGDEEVILGFRGRGEIIGEIAVLDGASRSASVKTQTPCVIAYISRHDFWNTLWPMSPMPYNLSCLLADRVRRLTSQLQAMACLDAPGRLARQILALSQEHAVDTEQGSVIPFAISQIELAQMIGATRVQVNRTIKLWKEQEIITVKRHSMIIHQTEKLQQILEQAENVKVSEK